MAFDLGRIMQQKHERECARLDDFAFRLKARTIKLVATWARSRAVHPGAIDPVQFASAIAVQPVEEILADLRRSIGTGIAEATWRNTIDRAAAEAHRSLVSEMGDPSPYRLA
jgi:hypothetical protein